jgi:hypothetical protein
MNKKELLQKLDLEDPFINFQPLEDTVMEGWNGESPIFPGILIEVKPKLIIEVGCWMGQSSRTMASVIKQLNMDCSLIAIDTWLGSKEHWQDKAIKPKLGLEYGYPTIYFNYLSNMKLAGLEDYILPLPMPSTIGAAYLKDAGIKADVIYVDGSHEQEDVYRDCRDYWELLNPNGIMFGDDYEWGSVKTAVKAFSSEIGTPHIVSGINWVFRKIS